MPAKSVSTALLEIRKTCTENVTIEMLDRAKFGKALRQLRIDKEISLRSMAKIMGVSPPYLSDMELGHRRMLLKHQMAFMREVLK